MKQRTASPGGQASALRDRNIAALRDRAIAALTAGRLDEGIALLEQALALAPSSGTLLGDLGTAHWQKGDPAKAEDFYRKAVQQAPRDAFALNAYGAFLLEQWKLGEAEKLLKRALAANPGHAEALNNMGLLQHRLGNFPEAKRLLLEAMRRAPRWAAPYANLGAALQALGETAQAEQAFKQALKLDPRNAFAWCELGEVFFIARRDAEAAECFSRARALAPAMEVVWARSLALLERTNRLDDAQKMLAEAKRHCPASAAIALQDAKLLRRAGKTAEGIAALEKLRPAGDAPGEGYRPFVSEIYAELGQLYDREGDAGNAFACFSAANAMEARRPEVRGDDHTAVLRTIARLKEEFTADLAQGPVPAALPPGRPVPVFLVGFPRSGTTLLDQILSSHPGVFVAEEKGVVNDLARSLNAGQGPGYPQALAQLSESGIAQMQERFFEAHGLAAGGGARPVFVDKLPLNLFHAGFIRRIFPQAKFVLALRHPCDSVLSCYMQLFRLNQSMKNFLDLGDAARLYDAAMGLWEHYAAHIPLDARAIKYEDVVGDFRATVGGLLNFLGLPWDEAVMDYDRTARERGRIGTPSYHQVTEKIYTRARGRWLRYRAHMEPVLGILKPWAEKYGYSMTDGCMTDGCAVMTGGHAADRED